MSHRRLFLSVLCAVFALQLLLSTETSAQNSRTTDVRKVILDTDPSMDPDDVGCMAMLHSMANRGECEILAVINSIHHREGSLSISAINKFYNRPAIPVGDYKGYDAHAAAPGDLYSHMLAKEYPRTMKRYSDAHDSVTLYREILASAEPKSITIVVIGTMHNLSALLQSEDCQFSPLGGIDLVEAKVKQVVTMGGNFIDGKGHDRTNWGGSHALCKYTSWSCLNKERNAMCRFVIENCKAPFVASGWEVGCGDYHNAERGNVMTGQALKRLPADHIVRRSYEYHFATRGGSEKIDRHSNDQCALLYAIRGEGQNFESWLDGKITLNDVGDCRWDSKRNGKQGYIQKKRSKELIGDEIEALMMGKVASINNEKPNSPTDLRGRLLKDKLHLQWNPSKNEANGSWIVGYRIYRDKELIGTAFGTQFLISEKRHGFMPIEIRAINSFGIESDAVKYVHQAQKLDSGG